MVDFNPPKRIGKIVWITGLSGSGKTTLGNALHSVWPKDRACIFLDGDALRTVFDSRVGHTRADRISLGLTYSRLAHVLQGQGFDVIVATISMHNEVYAAVKALPGSSIVYLATPLSECARRDPKRIYENYFTRGASGVAGLDVEVDVPQDAHIVVHPSSEELSPRTLAPIVSRVHSSLWDLRD